jgi:serine/threonine-protein kinase HipA
MVSRGDAFVDYASEVGATVVGATDTQGEAPKFWVVEDDDGRWHPDTGDVKVPIRRHMLLKFPVPEAGPRALDILRHEAIFQCVAREMGLRVTPQLPLFIGDAALLIPRFDRRYTNGKEIRLGVESLYSVAGVLDSSTATLRHHEAIIALARCVTDLGSEVIEYVRRDLLNVALGNRDNHGRNTAVLKETNGTVKLSPLYDLGPAFLDARAIARVMRWDGEDATTTDWNFVLANLATYLEDAEVELGDWRGLAESMKRFADELDSLPDLMRRCRADHSIIEQRREPIAKLARELRGIEVK